MNPMIRLAATELSMRLSPSRIDKSFLSLPFFSPTPATEVDISGVPVCILQIKAAIYKGLPGFIEEIDSYMKLAAEGGAKLVCFPELFGLFAAFASPVARGLFRFAAQKPWVEEKKKAENGKKKTIYLPAIFKYLAFLPERYLSIMSRFARRYGMWISCGSVITYEDGKLFNRHTLLDDKGKVAGVQDKLHLVPEEREMGLSVGNDLEIVSTPFGNIALTVCMDATYFETFKIAKVLGADFAIVPIANLEPYNYHLALRGAAMRATECNMAIVKPALVAGEGFPLEFTGRAGVYYPAGFKTAGRESGKEGEADVLIERLDIDALRRYKPDNICLANRKFNENYLESLIERGK